MPDLICKLDPAVDKKWLKLAAGNIMGSYTLFVVAAGKVSGPGHGCPSQIMSRQMPWTLRENLRDVVVTGYLLLAGGYVRVGSTSLSESEKKDLR